jgi:hypothetical protein
MRRWNLPQVNTKVMCAVLTAAMVMTGFRHIGTKSVSAYMRSYFGHLNTVNFVIFLNNMFQVLLPMKGDHWLIVLVEKQKSSISVYHRFYFRCYSIGKNTAKTRHNFLAHRHIADYAEYDYLIGMDSANIRNMLRIFGGDPDGKVARLLSYAGSERDISDPWYTGEFGTTYNDVLEGCTAFLQYLQQNGRIDT